MYPAGQHRTYGMSGKPRQKGVQRLPAGGNPSRPACCPETHAAHGGSEGWSSGGCEGVFVTESSALARRRDCLETTYGSWARFWPLGAHLTPPNRRLRSARGFALRPSRGSAAGASGPSWRSIWTLPWRRAPTPAGTSLVKDGLLEPRLPLGHAHQCMCEA